MADDLQTLGGAHRIGASVYSCRSGPEADEARTGHPFGTARRKPVEGGPHGIPA